MSGLLDSTTELADLVSVLGASTGAAESVEAAESLCPGASISTRTSPTFATVPSSTMIFLIVPVTGEGISSTDLSFWTSNKVSSSSIVSPALTNHLTISPSAIPSPISGNLNWKTPPPLPLFLLSTVGSAAGASGVCDSAATPSSPSLSSCPGASISTKTSPTFATVPSSTMIFLIVPVTGEGISSTDLSF